jgi:hypothetical protein
MITMVDGNPAAIRLIIAGTQKGNLETPRGIIRATNKKIRIDGVEFSPSTNKGN